MAHIGLTSQWSVTEAETTSESSDSNTPRKETPSHEVELDPEKTKHAEDMINLWNTLSKIKQVQSLGLCDVETDIFKKIYNDVQIKPKNVQVIFLVSFWDEKCISFLRNIIWSQSDRNERQNWRAVQELW